MNKMWEWTNTGDSVPVTAKAFLPSTSAVTIELAYGVSMITFVNTVRARSEADAPRPARAALPRAAVVSPPKACGTIAPTSHTCPCPRVCARAHTRTHTHTHTHCPALQVPISENRSINRFCLIRNFGGWEGFDSYARAQMLKILGEDKAMVELLRPDALEHEYSLGPDGPQVAFRKLRDEWVRLGYASRDGIGRKPRTGRAAPAPDM